MLDFKNIATPSLLSYPKIKTENGIHYKLESFVQTSNGFDPVYVETDDISIEEALNIILGGEE